MRALLVVNPAATGVSARTRDVIVRALGSELKVDLADTARRGHAIELARQARLDGLDLVVVFGGDGTVNEVVNGLLANGPTSSLPAVAVVPGGGADVLARTLGVPRDPVEATGAVLDAVRAGRRRTIGLGRADDRYFTFCAGYGLDAEVVRLVERRRESGAAATPDLYVRCAIRQFFLGTDRRQPAVTMDRPGGPSVNGLFLGIVANTNPWTYLGERPVQPCPQARFEEGLDLLALRRLGVPSTLWTLRQVLSRRPRLQGRHLVKLHDAASFTLRGSRPVAVQVDGDYLGERREVTFRAVPRAVDVLL